MTITVKFNSLVRGEKWRRFLSQSLSLRWFTEARLVVIYILTSEGRAEQVSNAWAQQRDRRTARGYTNQEKYDTFAPLVVVHNCTHFNDYYFWHMARENGDFHYSLRSDLWGKFMQPPLTKFSLLIVNHNSVLLCFLSSTQKRHDSLTYGQHRHVLFYSPLRGKHIAMMSPDLGYWENPLLICPQKKKSYVRLNSHCYNFIFQITRKHAFWA